MEDHKSSHCYGGERTRACTVCGKTETETLPRLTSILFDGDRGSAAASGGYSFPNGSALGIKDVTSSLGADERKKLEDAAKADGMTLVAVIDVAFTQNGKSFSPEGTLTLVLKIQSGSAGKYRIYKSGARLADATCADGYVTFAASGAFGRFAVAFAAVPDGTTAHDSTASDTTPTTSAPDAAPEGPDSTSELTPASPESSDASAETTKEGINGEALQKTIKTVLIRHIRGLCDYYGERTALQLSRKYVCWYCKGLHDAKRFREQYTKIGSLAEAFAAAEAYFDGLEKDITEEER